MSDHGFRLPTEEEKAKYEQLPSDRGFRLPTEEEKAELRGKEESPLSNLGTSAAESVEDILSSGAHGLTAGWSEEILGKLKAYRDIIASKELTKENDLERLYKQYRDIEEERYARAKERSPVLSTASEVGGAIAPALFTGGATAAATAPTLLGTLAKVAVPGAISAAVGHLGEAQELNEEEFKKAALAGAGGAALGSGLSAAGSLLKGTLKWGAQKLGSTDLGRQTALARELTKEGTNLLSDEFRTQSSKFSEGLTKKIYGALWGVGGAIDDSLVAAGKQGVKIAADDASAPVIKKGIDALQESGIFGSETSTIVSKLTDLLKKTEHATGRLIEGGISPSEANALRREIRDALADAAEKGKIGFKESESVSELLGALKTKLDTIPDFKQSNELYENVARKISGAAGGKGLSETVQIINPVTGEAKLIKTGIPSFSDKSFADVFKDFNSMVQKIKTGAASSDEKVAAFQQLERGLGELKQTHGESLKRFGLEPDKILSDIKRQADVSAISRGIHGIEQQEQVKSKLAGVASPSGGLFRVAGLVGEAEKGVQSLVKATPSVIKTPVDLTRTLVAMPKEKILSLGQKLAASDSPRLRNLGNHLAEAAATNNSFAMSGVIFTLAQTESLRKDLVPFLEE
jgi:hypothetical protein